MAKKTLTDDERHRLIRHHIEEASVNLGMVRQLIKNKPIQLSILDRIGKGTKHLYRYYGGHPDA